MKRIKTLMIAMLCSSIFVIAQPSMVGPCQLGMVIPNEFIESHRDATEMIYVHKRNNSVIKIAKTTSEEGLFKLKSVAMNRYDELLANVTCSGRSIDQIDVNGREFFILSWSKETEGAGTLFQYSALTEKCGTLYEFTLSSTGRYIDKMDDLYFDLLESMGEESDIQASIQN